MSHKTIYIALPAAKVGGDTSREHIDELTDFILSPYVEETAAEGMMRIDWYKIGGRWTGAFAALKSAPSAYLPEDGGFGYEFIDRYDLICNSGERGPYIAGKEEFIPVNGACNKDIEWDALDKLNQYSGYRYMEMVLNRDERVGGEVPDELEIIGDELYMIVEDDKMLFLKRGESFEERNERMEIEFDSFVMPPDAYIDLDGVWHDDNDIWERWEKGGPKAISDVLSSGGNPQEVAFKEFVAGFYKMRDSLQDDDYILVVDGHAFP